MSDPIWIDPNGSEYRSMHPVPAHWVRYIPHDESADEIARLRAEVERLSGQVHSQEGFIRAYPDAVSGRRWEEVARLLSGKCRDLEKKAASANAALSDERRHVDALAEALEKTRDALSSICHSEFDGVWDQGDFDWETRIADVALAQHRARRQGDAG